MFTTDQKRIAEIATASPQGLRSVVTVAMVSARMHFREMPGAMEDIKLHGVESKYLLAYKRDGYRELTRNHQALWIDLVTSWNHNPTATIFSAMDKLLRLPGLGMVKAGFALQMLTGQVGCLDTHNLERLGIPRKMVNTRKDVWRKSPHLKYRHVKGYIKLCADLGGAEKLWDDWCNHVAEQYPNVFADGQHVSKFHVDLVEINA